jgi:hypothetical protein
MREPEDMDGATGSEAIRHAIVDVRMIHSLVRHQMIL